MKSEVHCGNPGISLLENCNSDSDYPELCRNAVYALTIFLVFVRVMIHQRQLLHHFKVVITFSPHNLQDIQWQWQMPLWYK